MQAAIRAFIVDNAPVHQQEDANAWAGRMSGFGNILGYLSGYVELPRIFPFFGNTQFKVLCVIAAFALGSTVIFSSTFIHERDPRLEGPPKHREAGLVSFFQQMFSALRRLPPQIRKICQVQFFNWMGWFPFLFYYTTYIGQIYLNPYLEAHPNLSPHELDVAWEEATRMATFTLLIFAISSFASSILLPFLIVPSYKPVEDERPKKLSRPALLTRGISTQSIPISREKSSRVSGILSWFKIPGLTLRRAWLLSHILFAICMASTFFITTTVGASVVAGFVGITWSLTLWAPFALISADISKRDATRRRRQSSVLDNSGASIVSGSDQGKEEDVEDQAGVILGLHNVAVSAPQIVATLISSLVFQLTQRERGAAGDDSVGWVLRLGGIAALAAAYMTSRVGEEGEEEEI